MKSVSVRDLQRKVRECLDVCQSEHVVITRKGKPAAIMVGVEGEDWETVVEMEPKFWKMIRRRPKQPTISFEELRAAIQQ